MSEERLILPKLKTNFSTTTSRSQLIECTSSINLNNNSRNEYSDNSKLILEVYLFVVNLYLMLLLN
jgi:hypothetical protein